MKTSTATYFNYVISSNQNHGPFQHNWCYFKNFCTIDLKNNIDEYFFFVTLLAELQITKHHPAFHHFRYLFPTTSYSVSNSGPTSPPIDIHRVALSSNEACNAPRRASPSDLATWSIGPRWGSISSNPRWFLPKVGDVSPNSSEFHHRVVPFQEFIRKILRVDAEVERMCSAVQVSVAISPKLQATQRDHFYHFWISHEIIMMSSLVTHDAVVSLLHWQKSEQTKRSSPSRRTTLVELLEPIHPNLSYLLSSSWEKQRLCHDVDTFCDDCWSSSATRAAPRLWASGRWFMFEIRLDTCATRSSLRIQLWNRDMPSFQSDPWSP